VKTLDFLCFSELFPVVTGRGTPRGVRGPPRYAEPASYAAPQGYGAAGRSLRPLVSSPVRLRPLPRPLRRPCRSVRPLGVEPGSAFYIVFTTSRRSSRLHDGLHGFVTVFTASRLRFLSQRCHVAASGRSCSGRPDVKDVALPLKPAGSLTVLVILPKGHPQVIINNLSRFVGHLLWVRIFCTVRPIYSFNVGFNARQHAEGRVSSRGGPRQGPCGLLCV
jgi:hypothetical protein